MAEVFDFGLQQHKIKMDGKFFENNLFAVSGDTGRRLEVQLLDSDNLVQNTTGISLRLNANVADQATYAEATLVDATQGLYKLDLPNGMLIAPGNWQFQWQIIGTSGEKLHSFAFTGSVGSNLSEGGSEATNFYLNVDELKQMQEDLVNGTFNSEVLETNIAEKLNNLEEQYAPKLNEVTAQLDQTTTDLRVYAAMPPFNVSANGLDQHYNLQKAIDYAFDSGINEVVLPKGEIIISKPLYLWGGINYINKAVSLTGVSMNDTTIHKNIQGGTGDGSIFGGIDSVAIHAPRDLSNKPVYNIKMAELSLTGDLADGTLTEYGIYSLHKSASMINERLHISKVKQGIVINAGTWQSTFRNIFINAKLNGFYIGTNGDGATSNTLENIYVYGAEGIAFRFTGTYTSVMNLAADMCTGTVYDFYYATMDASGMGIESNCLVALNVYASNVTVDALHIQDAYKVDSTVFNVSSNSTLNVNVVTIDNERYDIDGYLYKLGEVDSNLCIDTLVTDNKYLKQHTFTGGVGSVFSLKNKSNTDIMFRGPKTNMPFIGHDRSRHPFLDDYNTEPSNQGKAIFLDAEGSPLINRKGENLEWSLGVGKGDIFIENMPEKYGVAGYVCTKEGEFLRDCSFVPLQLVLGGSTASRPSSPHKFVRYYDEELMKEFMWNGSMWVNPATGLPH